MRHKNIDLNVDSAKTHKFFFFGGGEGHIKLNPDYINMEEINILIRFRNDTSIFRVLLTVDALREINPAIKIHLFIPYFPGARQDRRMVAGEPLTVKVYADIINALKLNTVHIFDPHSDVTPALINNVRTHRNWYYVSHAMHDFRNQADWESMVLVSPDAGANKKIYDLAKYLGGMPTIRADKLRNVSTGEIIETIVYADEDYLTGKAAVIVDDICARGGTFIALAKALKKKGVSEIALIVSHWEGIANESALKECGINQVYITNGLATSSDPNGYVKQYDVFYYMGNAREDEL